MVTLVLLVSAVSCAMCAAALCKKSVTAVTDDLTAQLEKAWSGLASCYFSIRQSREEQKDRAHVSDI